jgi:outer membrane protein assembly factor BamB
VSIGWWGRLLVADGFAFVPTFEGRAAKTVTALRLSDGRPAWTWTEWPGGDCGPRCDVVWSKPAAADEGLLLVTSDARSCPPGTPSVECDATPSYRTRVTALDIATGNRAWTRDAVRKDLLGEVAVVDGVVVSRRGRSPCWTFGPATSWPRSRLRIARVRTASSKRGASRSRRAPG